MKRDSSAIITLRGIFLIWQYVNESLKRSSVSNLLQVSFLGGKILVEEYTACTHNLNAFETKLVKSLT